MHGVTQTQINTRAKEMGSHVIAKLKEFKRAEQKEQSDSNAAWDLDQTLVVQWQEMRKLYDAYKKDEYEGHDVKVELAEAESDMADAKAALDQHREARKAFRGGVQTRDVHEWIAFQGASVKWRPNIPELKTPKNSSPAKELDKARLNVDAIKASIRSAEIAWLPESEAFAKAVTTIDQVAITGAPDFRGLFRLAKQSPASRRAVQGNLEWPKQYVGSEFKNDGFALLVWLNRDALVERARTEIAALARPENALTVPEREAKLSLLRAKLLAAERLEEAWFLLAVKDDPRLQRRRVDMQALLQIEECQVSTAPVDTEDFG